MAVALTLAVQVLGSWSAPAANAADPSPTEDVSPAPLESPAPSDAGSPIPTIDPSPSDTTPPDPTADPGQSPEPTTVPDPNASPSADPSASPIPVPTPDPGPPVATPAPSDSASEPPPSESPTPEPTATPIPWNLSSGQQDGRTIRGPVPLFKLRRSTTAPDPAAIHTSIGISSPDCAACHAAHTAQSEDLIQAPLPASTLCLRCHSGAGSPYDVASQFAAAPTNDPGTDSYYRHLVQDGSPRQVTCDSCHNPHDANNTRPAMSTSGWTASGDTRAADGEAVTNGAAGTTPTYAPISRSSNGGSLTLEYQLCLACHSGATSLPTRGASHPSWWALDKGVELNPANASYHPIEAAGRNQSTQMAASLAGTSPFKAWNYSIDSTVRCTSCHGDSSTVNQTATGTPLTPAADAQEASHASSNRGLLIAPYRDRVLKASGEAYDPNDFALCYLCHAEAPLKNPNYNPSALDTAFPYHGFHLTNIPSVDGGGTSIDHPGDGEGLAICAECHFRVHSTAESFKPGDTEPVARATGSTGLVNFAPNVTGPVSTGPVWNVPGSNGGGSCTLICHGVTHTAGGSFTYSTAPGTGFTASPTNGPVGGSGLAVQFTDLTRYISAGSATWAWDFGDASTSTAQSPLHVYAVAGTYTVSLTVTRTTSDHLAATMTRVDYITATP
jgi:predicted CXXCH cytochrome family protein